MAKSNQPAALFMVILFALPIFLAAGRTGTTLLASDSGAGVRPFPPGVPASTQPPLVPLGPDAYAGIGIPPPAVPASMHLSPMPKVPDGGAGVGLFPPAVPASTELPPVPQGPDVAADVQLAYHAHVTMRGAARMSGHVCWN
jgi:hypothetical protein